MSSTTITFRISKELKNSCKDVLTQNGMSVSDYCKLCIQYLVKTGKPAIKTEIVENDDSDIEEVARFRLENPQDPVKININEL